MPGNPGTITATARALRTRAGELEQAGTGLSRIDTTEGWSGPAGDAFRAKFHGQPGGWLTAGDCFLDAAAALDAYSSTLTWAQQQAQQAITEWNAAQTATGQAQTEYQTYREQGGTQPFQDPGQSGRDTAEKTLDNARFNLETAGNTAARRSGRPATGRPRSRASGARSATSPTRSARARRTPVVRSSMRRRRSGTPCCTTPGTSPRWSVARS